MLKLLIQYLHWILLVNGNICIQYLSYIYIKGLQFISNKDRWSPCCAVPWLFQKVFNVESELT